MLSNGEFLDLLWKFSDLIFHGFSKSKTIKSASESGDIVPVFKPKISEGFFVINDIALFKLRL